MAIIDVHTHGIGGYDTRTTVPDDILRIAALQGSYGVTAIVPTLYPGRIAEMRSQLEAVRSAMEEQERNGADRDSARILGAHLEGPFLNPRRHGALDPGTFLDARDYHLRSIVEGFEEIIRIVTISPELDGAPDLIGQCADMGITVSMGHSDATFAEAEAGFQRGAKGITHLMNAMAPYHHREPGIAGFGLLSPHVYVEVIADPFHHHPKSLELIFTLKDPTKILIVSDSVKETHGRYHEAGETPVRDGSGALQGGSMTIAESSRRLREAGLGNDAVTEGVSTNPLLYMGLQKV